MKLEQTSLQSLESSPVTGISRGLIYYVCTGRNAWHSTWVKNYSPGCMHTTVESAKEYAENLRTSGTLFYISQLPSLVLRSNGAAVIITEINNNNPLSGYSAGAITKEVVAGFKKIDGALDNYLTIGAPLNGAALSFLPSSRFWNQRPSPKNSIIILSVNDGAVLIEKVNSDKLLSYKSFSSGGNYYLGWSSIDSLIKRSSVLALHRQAKPNRVAGGV
jgi:hypothetical protein